MKDPKPVKRIVPRLSIPRTGKFTTPPKTRLTKVIPVIPELPLKRKRLFQPLPLAYDSSFPPSPKRKRPRTGQTTPKKKRDSLNKDAARSPLGLGDSGRSFGNSDPWVFNDSDPFESGFSRPFADHSDQCFVNKASNDSSDDDDDFNLSATIAQIELKRKNFVPEYFELLQWNASSYAQISPRCYIIQDLNPRQIMLKVTHLFSRIHPQRGKYRHVFRMTDIDGLIKYHCDCAKGKKTRLSTTCLHIQLVTDHPDEFGDVLYDGEEPESVFICAEDQSLIFSVALQSGSARHHSHKRTIVSCPGNEEWRCQACVKEKYYPYLDDVKY
jgi:hypothetical protein